MTHPLTSREKVAQAVRAASRGQWTDGVRVGSAKWCNGLTDAILTALASGSGDHAELAKKPVAWRWRYKGTNWIFGADKPSWPADADEIVEPLFGEALLAENAALNDYGKSVAKEALTYRKQATTAIDLLKEMFVEGPVQVAFAGNPEACDDLLDRIHALLEEA